MPKMYFPQYRKAAGGIELFEGTVLEHARRLGVQMASECGGLGLCGRCVVRIEQGSECLNGKTAREQEHDLAEEERLACQASVVNPCRDVRAFIKDFGDYSIVTETIETQDVELDPFVRRVGDRVVHDSGEELGTYRGEIYGLAVDVGTTTLVLQVVDLEDGHIVATRARKNPQISYGNDVISRIGYAMYHEGGLVTLQNAVIEGFNEELEEVERQGEIIRDYVYDVVAVGNSTMRGIFFGQDVSSLGAIPFEPADCSAVKRKAPDIGLSINPAAHVYGGALIGGHAGADALADVIASRIYERQDVAMVIDIGTNGEVIIGNRDRLMSASCAAGGAYEGATIKCGLGAVEGAIKNIWMTDNQVRFDTIGGKPPVGICGSGLIDLLAELLRTGHMSRTAKIKDEFHITDSIGITQPDIYELITAKAGLRLDQDLLMKYYGVTIDDVAKVFLAGGFGSFVNPDNAVAIGLLPPAADKVVRIGNGALAGARQMLLSRGIRRKSERIARMIQHTKPNELEPDFPYLVAEEMYF